MSSTPNNVIGPHQIENTDARLCRPYYLINLDRNDKDPNSSIKNQVIEILKSINSKGEISDIFIISHGWHRNIYSAISAYDRIVSRLGVLTNRGKLKTPKEFNPLFITVHWHSDPGDNAWTDPAGRRNKDSFLDNARKVFQFSTGHGKFKNDDPSFLNTLESAFEVFARWCVSEPTPETVNPQWKQITSNLSHFKVVDAPHDLDIPTKIMLLWDCYHRALPRKPLINQNQKPQSRIGTFTALGRIISFAIAAAGMIFLPKIGKIIIPAVSKVLFWPIYLSQYITLGTDQEIAAFKNIPNLELKWHSLFPALNLDSLTQIWNSPSIFLGNLWNNLAIVFLITIASYIIYNVSAALTSIVLGLSTIIINWITGNNRSVNPISSILWFLAIFYFVGPYIFFLILLLLFGRIWFSFLNLLEIRTFDERSGTRGENISNNKINSLGESAGEILRIPTKILKQCLHEEAILPSFIQSIDSQVAFYMMQIKAIRMGQRAAIAIEKLLSEMKDRGTNDMRIHLFGHSFGGLLILNLWRNLVMIPDPVYSKQGKLASVTLLEAAAAADWLQDETKMLQAVDAVGCVFSRYDTANGFYYPLANGSRNAAGYVGLKLYSKKENKEVPRLPAIDADPDGLFASLVDTPNLEAELQKIQKPVDNPDQKPADTIIVNLDASRMIYDGPPASGGGHSDIFKDDVIYLCWGVISLSKGWESTRTSRFDSNTPPS